MAWVAQHRDGRIASVGFDRAQAPTAVDVSIIDIADELAISVMDGRLNMQHVISGPPPAPSITPVEVSRTLGNSSYPSMMHQADMDALARISMLVVHNAVCVEIGSRLGGSAKIILDNAAAIKRLYCIDIDWAHNTTCAGDSNLAGIAQTHGIDPDTTIHDYAKSLLSDYAAARLLPMSSPYELSWWTETVDFIFEDSSHANPQLRDNLDFWVPLVRSGGIIAGHDYVRTWPDVVQEVDELAARLGATLQVQGSVWWMIKP
jgi:predicted O-methyltransferase YrrM